MSMNAGTLTIARDDTGARALVDLSRRRVLVVDR
jgi:imidazoleglycerol phosphate dehydratase HisB